MSEMSDTPLFSVLIANFNNSRYLPEALESVLSQTYAFWEVIIVDDASSDDSEKVYEQYSKDSRIRVFRNEKNMGCGYTKKRCAELASGELCGFLDPDDVLLPNSLSSMVRAHRENPEVSLVMSRHYLCDEELSTIGESRFLKIKEGMSYFTSKDYSVESFASFKKRCYDLSLGISPKYKLGVDQDLYFKLEEVAPAIVLDEFTYKYRLHDKSIAHDEQKSLYWNVIVRHDVCMRRGLPPEEYSMPGFYHEYKIGYYDAKQQIEASKEYRMGELLMRPYRWLKGLL